MFDIFPPVANVVRDGSRFADYINHCAEWKYYSNNLQYDKPTAAHECTHGIHAYLRNTPVQIQNHLPIPMPTAQPKEGRRARYYLGQDRAITLPEPTFRKADVIRYIPTNLREYRFSTYVSGQTAWDDTPSYLFDEFVSYCNGTEVAIHSDYNQRTDQALGPLEFMIYCTGFMFCLRDRDPSLVEQWDPFYYWLMNRADDLVRAALVKFPWPEAESLRIRFFSTSMYRNYHSLSERFPS